MLESAEIQLLVAKKEDLQIVSRVVDWTTDAPSKMNIFKWYVEILTDCEGVTGRCIMELMTDARICGVLVRGVIPKRDGGRTQDWKNVSGLLRKHTEICGKDNIMLCPLVGNALSREASPNMTTENI